MSHSSLVLDPVPCWTVLARVFVELLLACSLGGIYASRLFSIPPLSLLLATGWACASGLTNQSPQSRWPQRLAQGRP